MKTFLVGGCLALGLLCGCSRDQPERPQPTEQEEESPTARILPAPLSPAASGDVASEGMGGETTEGTLETRAPVPLPSHSVLPLEDFPHQVGTGLSLRAHFAWPEVKRTVALGGEAREAWPTLDIDIASDSSVHTARQRIEFTSSLFTMPEGTELRSRLDSDGWVVVWPDDRSYRVVPRGALRAVLEERRVDRVPSLPLHIEQGTPGKRLGKETESIRIENALGTLEVELASAPEIGNGGQLLCRFVLDLFRAPADQPWCAPEMVLVRAAYEWKDGTKLLFVVEEMTPQASMDLSLFRMPPALAIFKPGELPPERYPVWPLELLREAFPANEAGDALVFENTLTVPLYVTLDETPLTRIAPSEKVRFVPRQRDYKYAARDFLGHVRLVGGTVAPPAEVWLGAEPEIRKTPPVPPVAR